MPEPAETGENPVIVDTPQPGVKRLLLNRPTRLNAITSELLETLHDHLQDCHSNTSVRCVLLAGAGRGFCAGQDLNDRDPRTWDHPPDLEAIQCELFHPVIKTILKMPKPVIVAVHGVAAGAGSSIALAGDIVLAARTARFVQSFVKVGLSVDAGGGWQLVQALGAARARGLLMTGGTLTGEEAERAGLIWKSTEDDALTDEALDLAVSLAAGPTQALAAVKSAVHAAETNSSMDAYLQAEAELQGRAGRTSDYPEGVLAFLEKRMPEFRGN